MNVYNLKDIIRLNQEIGENGHLIKRSGNEFELDRIHKEKSWLRQAAMIVRALICDHAFQDGNKRTALMFAIGMFEIEGWEYDPQILVNSVHAVSRKNIVDISKIERLLKNALVRKIH